MPVVKSHHKLFFERPNAAEKANRDISSVISGITNDILRECPSLVADVWPGAPRGARWRRRS